MTCCGGGRRLPALAVGVLESGVGVARADVHDDSVQHASLFVELFSFSTKES